ncbi:MAG: hypothetical protein RSA97_09150, partial [Oscillospiraceae bacterium]
GTFLVQLSPLKTFIVCVVPRVLMGFLVGVIFSALYKSVKARKLSYVAASFSGAVLNTVFFMGALFLLFGGDAGFLSFLGTDKVTLMFIASMVGINGVLESVICLPFGFAVERIVYAVNKNSSAQKSDDSTGEA